jgi:hypothetical protein
MNEQEIWVIGTEPPCPRCGYLSGMVKDVLSDLQLPVSVRHLGYTDKEARQFAATYGLEPGTAKDVACKAAVDIDWEKVHALIDVPDSAGNISPKESCCPTTIGARWSSELDELLRPCEIKSRDAGIMMTPVLVVGGRCVHQGSVPAREQVVRWVKDVYGDLAENDPDNCIVEVLGPGCAKCDHLYQNVIEALNRVNLSESVTLKKRTDFLYFQRLGVTVTPALVIDGRVRSKGRVLTADQIIDLLQKGRVDINVR